MGKWQQTMGIRQSLQNWGIIYPSPAPFEYPWLKANHHKIMSEKGYMVLKEKVRPEHFLVEGKRVGIMHDWRSPAHHIVSCSVCRKWTDLNPPDLNAEDNVLDPNAYQLGNKCWGYFACA